MKTGDRVIVTELTSGYFGLAGYISELDGNEYAWVRFSDKLSVLFRLEHLSKL